MEVLILRQSKVYNLTDKEFRQLIKEASSISECCKQIGLSEKGSNGRTQIIKRCEELQIDYSHLLGYKPKGNNPQKQPIESILVKNSTYLNRTALKKRLIDEKIIPYRCAICGNKGEWNSYPLTLQLDHINGINNDNRKENLRFLCPNCHSQTTTFSGRNKR